MGAIDYKSITNEKIMVKLEGFQVNCLNSLEIELESIYHGGIFV